MTDLNYIDRTIEVKIAGQDATGLGVNYVTADANGNMLVKDYSDGPVTPGAVASASALIGGQFNTALPTLTNTQQSSVQLDSSGRLIIAPLTNISVVKAQLQDNSGNGITSASNGNAGNQLLHIQNPDTTTATTTLGALNATIQVAMAGLPSVGFQLNSGTLIGTIVAEFSIDGGTTWLGTSFFDLTGNDTFTSIVFSSSNGLKIQSIVLLGGTSHVRVRVSAYTSGSATALLRASNATGGGVSSSFNGNIAAFGTVTNTFITPTNNTATLLLAANPVRKYAAISNPSGSQLNIMLGSSTGLTATSGYVVIAKSFFELKGENLFTGAIYGFMAGGAALTIVEGTL